MTKKFSRRDAPLVSLRSFASFRSAQAKRTTLKMFQSKRVTKVGPTFCLNISFIFRHGSFIGQLARLKAKQYETDPIQQSA